MKYPLVSVVMASYNGEDHLEPVLESLLKQNYPNFEVILVNDCSKDRTLEIFKKYQPKFKHCSIINNKTNLERCESRNLAIKVSKGKYIAIVDDDDIQLSDRLLKGVEFLENNLEVYLVAARAQIFNKEGKKLKTSYGSDEVEYVSEGLFLKMNPIVHSSVLFRNTNQYWYRHEMRYAEDYDLYLQILTDKHKLAILPDILVHYLNWVNPSSEYRYKQIMLSDIARSFYYERKTKDGIDSYTNFTQKQIESFLTDRCKLQLRIEKAYWNKEYIKVFLLELQMIFRYGYSKKSLVYMVDSISFGNLRKIFLK